MERKIDFQRVLLKYLVLDLLVILLVIPCVLFGQKLISSERFSEELLEKVAIKKVETVRGRHTESLKSVGVWYDTATIINYIRNIMPTVINRMAKNRDTITPPGHMWVLGFYWMLTEDNDNGRKTRRTFCVVPTLIDTTKIVKGKRVLRTIDYFNDLKKEYCHPDTTKTPEQLGFKGNVYDAGHLYP